MLVVKITRFSRSVPVWSGGLVRSENIRYWFQIFFPVYSNNLKCHTLMVLNTLNPLCAVLIIRPGICGCQWSSFISFWPWCMNSNCGGRSSVLISLSFSVCSICAFIALSASSSFSTAKSQIVSRSSSPDAANTVESFAFHSTLVMGLVWCFNMPTGLLSYEIAAKLIIC